MQIIQCSVTKWIRTMDYKLLCPLLRYQSQQFSGEIWENHEKQAAVFQTKIQTSLAWNRSAN